MNAEQLRRWSEAIINNNATHGDMIEIARSLRSLADALEKGPEPVAWGEWDTQLGKGHRLMMCKPGPHGGRVPLFDESALLAARMQERARCVGAIEQQRAQGFVTANGAENCIDAIRALGGDDV